MTQRANLKLKPASGPPLAATAAPPTIETHIPDHTLPEAPTLGLTVKEQRSLWGDAWRRFRRHKLAMIGAAVLLFFSVAVIVGHISIESIAKRSTSPRFSRLHRASIRLAPTISGATTRSSSTRLPSGSAAARAGRGPG